MLGWTVKGTSHHLPLTSQVREAGGFDSLVSQVRETTAPSCTWDGPETLTEEGASVKKKIKVL